jgi:hypothetical protein
VSRSVPDRARTLAAALVLRIAQDAQLATRLNDFHQRLQRANERLWSGLHPDGIAAVYDERPTAIDVASAQNRCEVLGAPNPLQAVQRIHWQIHGAHCDYQAAAERRRELAALIGELSHEFIATLVAAGRSEQDARVADVDKLANTMTGGRSEENLG